MKSNSELSSVISAIVGDEKCKELNGYYALDTANVDKTMVELLTDEANEVIANYENFKDYEPELDLENAEMLLEHAVAVISRLVKFINR